MASESIIAMAKKKFKKLKTIKQVIKKNGRISFNTVSIESVVSQSYLYNHPAFLERIEMLRKQPVESPKAVKRQMSDESTDAKI